jgi:hypothetical protein
MTQFFEQNPASEMSVLTKLATATRHLLGECVDNSVDCIKGYTLYEDVLMMEGSMLNDAGTIMAFFVVCAYADGRSTVHVSTCKEGVSRFMNQYCLWDSKLGVIIRLEALLSSPTLEKMDEVYQEARDQRVTLNANYPPGGPADQTGNERIF